MIAHLRTLIITAAALALSGCVSLLPDTDPSQLYSFGASAPETAAARSTDSFGLILPSTGFARAASGDRILTMTGAEAAYVASARWVAPAGVLFEEAVAKAFDDNPGPARLVTRGEVRDAASVLRLDVRQFETVYDRGQDAAPVVVVRVRATLVARDDRTLVAEEIFQAEVRAADNRVSQIVTAYDAAVGDVLNRLVDWSNRNGAPGD